MSRHNQTIFPEGQYVNLGMTESLAAQMNSNLENYYEKGRMTSNAMRGATIDATDEGDDDVIEIKGDAYKRQKKEEKKKSQADKAQSPDVDLVQREKDRQNLLAKLRGIKGSGQIVSGNYMRDKKRDAIKAEKLFEEETKGVTVNLIERMHNACLLDYEAVKNKKSAMNRFQLCDEVTQLLKKKHIQDVFLQMNGCRFLEMWISQNPDGSFPPFQIIDCVLKILDCLPITQEHLETCQVARAVTQYAAGSSSLEQNQLPPDLISFATKLLQKWQTVVYQLSYEYDQNGMHEIKQRDLRRRLEVLREIDQSGGDKKTLPNRDDDLIKKTPNGFIFIKQNFDWLEKPQSNIDPEMMRINSVKQSLKNVFKTQKSKSMRNSNN